jgi:hypothetical protein
LILMLALALPAYSQTWFTIATLSGFDNPLVTSTGPVTYQYGTNSGTTIAGANCATSNCFLPSVTATLTNFQTLWSTFPSDPAPGVSKVFQILETCTAQTGTVGGVAYTIPALTNCAPPAITFTPGASYTFTASNVPPATPTSPLTVALSIQIGPTVVNLKCTYGTTLVNGTAEAAVFNCIPQ